MNDGPRHDLTPRKPGLLTRRNEMVMKDQQPLSEGLQSIPVIPRYALILVLSAVIANYAPLLLMAVFGVWVNILSQHLLNVIMITILIVGNLVGNKLGRIMVCGIVLAVGADLYGVSLVLRNLNVFNFAEGWPRFLHPTIAFPLNAFLFLKYKEAAGLRKAG